MPRPPTPVPFIQTGNPAMDRLQRFVAQALPGKQDSWVAPKLINGWVNYGAGTMTPGYMKDSIGFVHLRGLVKSGTATVNTVFFNLPIGYRPSAELHFAVDSNSAFGELSITSGGDVRIQAGSNVYFSFDGVSFDTRP